MSTALPDVADVIRDVNATNEVVEDQCLRACQAADIAARSTSTAELLAAAAQNATVSRRTGPSQAGALPGGIRRGPGR